MSIIELKEVSKKYDDGEKELLALDKVSLCLNKGECVGIVGASGSGKSTMLNIMGILEPQTSGEVLYNDVNLSEMNSGDKIRFRAESIGFIFQSFNIEPNYTVYQNVEIPLLLTDMSKKDRKEIVIKMLEKLGIEQYVDKKAKFLSGGEKQRVAIARALIRNPEVILADEPCGNLDGENSENIMKILKELTMEGKLVVVVTHDVSALKYFDRVVDIINGRLVER